jgi:hypothetical protein
MLLVILQNASENSVPTVAAALGGISALFGLLNTFVITDLRNRISRLEDRVMEGKK